MSFSQQYPSTLLQHAVNEMSRLPGIGRKSALRLVLHMLRMDPNQVDSLAGSLSQLVHEVRYCRVCHNISDVETCAICADSHRDAGMVCVVENVQDVMAIEQTQQYSMKDEPSFPYPQYNYRKLQGRLRQFRCLNPCQE